ncbi:MAG TPA: hypothetical protein PLW01_02510 [Agitococcus sp.]|nr:hypothetical protein [Agitococcus sp.]
MAFKFDENTCETVKTVLTECYNNQCRIRIWYGDADTGVSWLDEYDVTGTIGRSTGKQKIPLLIKNSRSSGGGGILCHCIIRIDVINSRRTIYKHPRFNVPTLGVYPNLDEDTKTKYPFIVLKYGSIVGRFKTEKSAYNYVDFMTGDRYTTGGK